VKSDAKKKKKKSTSLSNFLALGIPDEEKFEDTKGG
jgi:hypothetical protein